MREMIEGSGIDIVEIQRIEESCERWGRRFLGRIFTNKEMDYSFEKRFPYQHLAARFAVKEAILKSFGNGWEKFNSLKLIEITNDADGKPRVELRGGLKELFEERNLSKIIISMSHSKKFAVATCIFEKNE